MISYSYLEKDPCWIPKDHCDFWDIVVCLCLAWLKTDHPPFRSLKQRDMSILYPNWVVNHCGKELLIMLLMCRQRRQSNRTMLLFESIRDLQSLHQKVVECQNKITQKTFQLLKKPAGNARHEGEIVLPENPGVESILTWNFPYTVDLCNHSMYNPVFTFRLCEWANALQWEVNATSETSFLELFLEYSFTTKTLAPCDTIKPPYFHLFDMHTQRANRQGFFLQLW